VSCIICKAEEWEYLDHLRDRSYWVDLDLIDWKDGKIGFKICRSCGFVSYDSRPDLFDHYRTENRKLVNHMNVVTTRRKWFYHEAFLRKHHPEILSADTTRKKARTVVDYGCAQGQTLAQFQKLGFDCTGYELNGAFANYGRKVLGLNIKEEPMPTEAPGSVDFVMCYHVLEHLPDPLEALLKIREILHDDGRVYLSTPYWFEALSEEPTGGGECLDFENLFHINHIDVFSKTSLQNLFRLAGFDIVALDFDVYGQTYLLKKGKTSEIVKEDWQKIVKVIEAQKQAIEHARAKDFEKAIAAYPNYPDAWVWKAQTDHQKVFDPQKKALEQALKVVTLQFRPLMALAVLYFTWAQDSKAATMTNNLKQAESLFEKLFEFKPENENSLYFLGLICENYKRDYEKALEYFTRLEYANPKRWAEVNDHIGFIGANWK